MKGAELQHFNDHLLTEQKTVARCLQHQQEYIEETNDEVLDPLTESEQNLVRKIQLALMKIEKRSYGICMTYSREIPKARLEVKPSALLCLNCQSEHESSSPSPAELPSPDSSRSGDFFT